ncbi:MAG TPA: DUF6350 family protein [Natronosporangium sp.]|nr:DUF6350 family protein [Natronosporangium sp.]
MSTRDVPPDPREVLEAAEAAHLAARRGGRGGGAATAGPGDHAGGPPAGPDAPPRPPVRSQGRARPVRRRAPLPLAAGVAAAWAALVTFLPVAAVVALLLALEQGPASGQALRVAAAGWLLAHGVPISTPPGPIGLAPLALTALAAWRVARAGLHVVRAQGARGSGSLRHCLAAASAVALAYAGIGVLAAGLAGGPGWGPAAPRAGATLAVFGLVTAGYGAARATRAGTRALARLPRVVRTGARGGVVATAWLLAAGAATAGTALALSGGSAAEVVSAYHTGVAGQAGLTLLCLAYAPNLAVWAAAYLVGPGFVVGVGTVVRSSEVVLGPLPVVPVFTALPESAQPGLGAALLAGPVVAGGVAGWLLVGRGVRGRASWGRLMPGAVVAGVVAGLLLGAAALASRGPLGGGQLATLGPEPVPVALWACATVTVGALLGGVAAALVRRVDAERPGAA